MDLQDLLHKPGISNLNRALLCLSSSPDKPMKLSEIRKVGVNAGWKSAKTNNMSEYLNRAKGLAITTPDGWRLTSDGKNHVQSLNEGKKKKISAQAAVLRAALKKLKDKDTVAFVEEAIECHEAGHWRSSIVLMWVGAVSVLYEYVISGHLASFNQEAARRNSKWKVAKNKDDLALMGEHEFLQIISAISIVGKSIKDDLEGCLKLRNGCGHPNSFKVGEAKSAAHIESLINNVFARFT